jgi:hypothetical protein
MDDADNKTANSLNLQPPHVLIKAERKLKCRKKQNKLFTCRSVSAYHFRVVRVLISSTVGIMQL